MGYSYSLKRSLCYNAGRSRITKQKGDNLKEIYVVEQQKGSLSAPPSEQSPMACEGVLLRLPSLVLARESSKMTPNLAASHVKVI